MNTIQRILLIQPSILSSLSKENFLFWSILLFSTELNYPLRLRLSLNVVYFITYKFSKPLLQVVIAQCGFFFVGNNNQIQERKVDDKHHMPILMVSATGIDFTSGFSSRTELQKYFSTRGYVSLYISIPYDVGICSVILVGDRKKEKVTTITHKSV